jgi:hypothetical protein
MTHDSLFGSMIRFQVEGDICRLTDISQMAALKESKGRCRSSCDFSIITSSGWQGALFRQTTYTRVVARADDARLMISICSSDMREAGSMFLCCLSIRWNASLMSAAHQ